MSVFTPFLNLLKMITPGDKLQNFNIQTMLNDNWDKVETFALGINGRLVGQLADLAALKAINTTSVPDTALGAIKTLGLYRFDKASVAAGDDDLVVVPTTGGGRWLLLISHLGKAVSSRDTIAHLASNAIGWEPVTAGETWTYASATTFTIAGDKTAVYQKGDKIKLTSNGVVLYAYINGVSYGAPNTTITVVGNALTNFAYTDNCFSRYVNPFGFPDWFAWVPTLAWGTATPSAGLEVIARYSISGKTCRYYVSIYTTNGAGATSLNLTLPTTALNSSVEIAQTGEERVGSSKTDPLPYLGQSTNPAKILFSSFSTATGGTTLLVTVSGNYEIAA